MLEKQGSTTTATYTYGNALVRKDGETPLFDGLGSERTVTNSSQTVVGTLTMDGFGNYVASSGSSSNPYMYAATSGYRNDGDAGLSHVGARYYDAQVGRFITRDTYLDQKPYLYCDHDPVNYTDPDGHDKVTITIDGKTITVNAPPGTTVTIPSPNGPIIIVVPPKPPKGGGKKPPVSGSVTIGKDATGNATGTGTVTTGNVSGSVTLSNHKKPMYSVTIKF